MSIVSSQVMNLIVVHEGNNIVYDSTNVAIASNDIRDIKRQIERVHNFSIGSQLISLDNTLLQENIKLEDLRFKYNSAIS